MFIFSERDLEKLTDEECVDLINALISNKIQESTALEYKAVVDNSNKEIARDFADKANSEGGYILYGLEEDEHGKPTKINWLDAKDKVIERLDLIASNSISPACKIKTHPITNPKNPAEQIFITYIPQSTDCLHAVTVDKDGRYYIRRNRSRAIMQPSEIQARYSLIERRKEREKEILREIEEEFYQESGISPSDSYENIILLPTSLKRRASIVELGHILEKFRGAYPYGGSAEPYCGGQIITSYTDKKKFERCVIVRPDLIIESREKISGLLADGKATAPQEVYKSMVKQIQFMRRLAERMEYYGGVRVIVNIKNASGIVYEHFTGEKAAELKQNDVKLDLIIDDLLTFEENAIKKKIEDVLIGLVSYAGLGRQHIANTLKTLGSKSFEEIERMY